MDDIYYRHTAKIIISAAAIVMLINAHFLLKGGEKAWRKWAFDGILVVLALASVAAYFEFGWLRYGRYMNPHDVYHYHMGAKYSLEHEYYNLYRASVIADHEMRKVYKQPTIRNLDTHRYESVAEVLKRSAEIKKPFTPERWEEFKKDTAYWISVMPGYKWNAVLRDKGYNATPVWNTIARIITNAVPTSSVWGMRCLTYIDLVLVVLMLSAIWAAFGWRVMLFALIFHGTNYFMAFVHIKGAFMRLDWLCATVLALCFLKLKRFAPAGAFLAYAVMARVFPILFAFGLGVKCGLNLFRNLLGRWKPSLYQPIEWRYFVFFAALALTCAGLTGFSAVADGGADLWRNFGEKISMHNLDISTNRAGFKYVFLGWAQNKAQAFQDQKLAWNAILAAMLLVTAAAARKLEDYETLALSFIPVYFMTAPTFYYFVMLLVPLLLFLPKLESKARLVGAVLCFAVSIFGYAINYKLDHNFPLFLCLSIAMLVFCVYMIFAAAIAVPVVHASPEAVAREDRSAWRRSAALLAACSLAVCVSIGGFALAATTENPVPKPATAPAAKPPQPVPPAAATTPPAPLNIDLDLARRMAAQNAAPSAPTAPPAAAAPQPARPGPALAALQTSPDLADLVFVGDVMFSRNVARAVKQDGRSFDALFDDTRELIQAADLSFANVECPISGKGEPLNGKNYLFNAPPESVVSLKNAGFDVISHANNHILDYGPIAMEDTLRLVAENGMKGIGITTEDEPQAPLILEIKGIRIGFLAYCDPVPRYSFAREFYAFPKRPAAATPANLTRDIKALRPQVDVLVVSLHWGVEYLATPDNQQKELGYLVMDLGADILAGHHPHVQQEPEIYNNKLIIYSMGNFVFDQHSRPPTRLSRIYRVQVSKKGIEHAGYLPAEIQNKTWQPVPTATEFVVIK